MVVGRAVDDGRAGHMKNTGAASGSWMAVGSGRYLGLSYVAERQQCGGRADRRWARDPAGSQYATVARRARNPGQAAVRRDDVIPFWLQLNFILLDCLVGSTIVLSLVAHAAPLM